MSLHLKHLTPAEEAGLRAHGLPVGGPSQLADAFRLGMAWAEKARAESTLAEPQPDAGLIARDDVNRMARESGLLDWALHDRDEKILRFAHLVIADFLQRTGQYVTNDASREAALEQAKAEEREACAKVCDDNHWEDHRLFADAIRTRGQK